MRTLRIFSGVGVLFATLGYGHLVAHFLMHTHSGEPQQVWFWAAAAFAIAAGFFSFIGGCLLLLKQAG